MNRKQLNLLMALIAVVLVGAIMYSQKKDLPKVQPLTGLTADAVNRIVIEHPGKPSIELIRKDKDWSLTAPVAALADPLQVSQILDLAAQPVKQTLDSAQVQKSALGLDPPAFTVQLNDVAVDFGGSESLSYGRYVQTGGKILLIDDPAPQPLDEDYSDLVAKTLLPANAIIDSIEVPGLVVRRTPDGKGWMTEPESGAQPAAVFGFVEAWHSARAQFNQAANEPGSGDPATITIEGAPPLHLLILAREPRLILERPDLHIRYVLDKVESARLLKITPLPAADPAPKPGEAAPAPAKP